MRKTIKANFINGSLLPLEPCNFNDGDEVLVQVQVANGTAAEPRIEQPDIADEPAEADAQSEENEPSALEAHPILATIERLKANLSHLEQPDELPTDAAKNYKHYLYGWPKESE